MNSNSDSNNTNRNNFIPKIIIGKFMHVTDTPLKRDNGKVLVYFLGAGFCPYCAAERWALVGALDKFGSWEGLVEQRSAGTDEKYLDIPTFSFAKCKYSSDFIEFIGKETSDRYFEPLNELNAQDYEVLDMFNPDQIIPFLLIDGQYMQTGPGFSPQLLEGMDHSKVRSEIQNPNSQIGKAIRTEIDNITQLLCKSIGNKAEICS